MTSDRQAPATRRRHLVCAHRAEPRIRGTRQTRRGFVPKRELSGGEEAAAVAALVELAGGRADLLAEVAGILEGTSEGELDEPFARPGRRSLPDAPPPQATPGSRPGAVPCRGRAAARPRGHQPPRADALADAVRDRRQVRQGARSPSRTWTCRIDALGSGRKGGAADVINPVSPVVRAIPTFGTCVCHPARSRGRAAPEGKRLAVRCSPTRSPGGISDARTGHRPRALPAPPRPPAAPARQTTRGPRPALTAGGRR